MTNKQIYISVPALRQNGTMALYMYQEIIDLNNAGVASLYSDPQTTLSLLHTAILQTRDLMKSELMCHNNNDSSQMMGLLDGCWSTDDSHPLIIDCAYVNPIHLTPSNTAAAFSQDPLVTLGCTFAVIEFNQAVLHHMYGLSESDSSSTHLLTRAQKCYFKALEIFTRLGESSKGTAAMADFLTLCIYNNLAQIASLLLDCREAKHQFRNLAVYASKMVQTDYESAAWAVLDWYKHVFLSHMQVFQFPGGASAA
jgi:hypothetical protein